jgi:hypothetical protein
MGRIKPKTVSDLKIDMEAKGEDPAITITTALIAK